MTYKVRVTLESPAHTLLQHEIEGPDSHSPRSVSDTMLQALKPLQQTLGVTPTTFDEVVAARGALAAMAEMLSDVGVARVPGEGAHQVFMRVGLLCDEVLRLRGEGPLPVEVRTELERRIEEVTAERDAAHGKIRAHGEVINGVRRALGVSPQTPDGDLPGIVGELVHEHDRAHRSLNCTAGAVCDSLEHVSELHELSRLVAKADGGDPPTTFDGLKRRVAALADAAGPPGAAHTLSAVLASMGLPPRYWASTSLDELLSVVERVADNSDRWLSLTPVQTATPEMLARALHAAQDALGSSTGHPFTRVDWDAQSEKARAHQLAVARHALEGLRVVPNVSLLPVTAQELGRAMYESGPHTTPWDEVHTAYTDHAQRVLDSLPSIAAPKPQELRVAPEQLARAMHAARAALTNESARSVSALRPPVFLPVKWEQLDAPSREWFERVAERALSELPQITRADRVVERLGDASWSDLMGRARKQGIAMPGEAFTFGPDGEPQKFRVFRAADDQPTAESIKAFGGGSMTVSAKTDADTIARTIESLSGGRIRAESDVDQVALLEQLRSMGQHVRWLEAEKARRDERFMRLREVTGLVGSTEDELIVKVSDLVADHEADQETSIAVAQESEEFMRGLARAAGVLVLNRDHLLSRVEKLARFERAHRACQGAANLQRELTGQLAGALGRAPKPPLGGEWGWGDLIHQVSNTADWQKKAAIRADDLRRALRLPEHVSWDALVSHAAQANSAVGYLQAMLGLERQAYPAQLFKAVRDLTGRSQDLSRALGLNSGESWEDMIEIVTGRTSRADTDQLEVNALAAIREALGLHPKLFPAGVVDAVRSLKSSRDAMAEGYPHLFSALGVEVYALSGGGNVATAVSRALDAIRDLKAAAVFEPGERADAKRVRDAVFTLVEAAGISLGEDEDAPDVAVQKAGDAAAILRSWPDVLRAVNAFDGDEVEQPDEVEPVLQGLVKAFRERDRYVGVVNSLERLLAAHRGDLLKPDLETMYDRVDNMTKRLFAVVEETGQAHGLHYAPGDSKPRFADMVLMNIRNHMALNSAPMWAALAEQIADRFESWAKLNLDAEPMSKLVSVPGVGIKKDRQTLEFAADVVREHAGWMVSGERPHPLVMALQDNTFWAPDSERSDLELVPHADGGIELRLEKGVKVADRIGLEPDELAPVGAALLMLARHRVQARAAGAPKAENLARFRDSVGGFAKSVRQAVETAAAPPTAKTIKVLSQTQTWTQGPNTLDSDPGKRWHVGCGGEVTPPFTAENKGTCASCGQVCVPHEGAPMITVTEVSSPFVDGGLDITKAAGLFEGPNPLEWSYGPTEQDPDPGKRWHIGCGGEVLTFDGVDACSKCEQEDGVQAAESIVESNADAESGR